MKKFIVILVIIISSIGFTGCSISKNNEDNGGNKNMNTDKKELVLYFSATGTTEKVANVIARVTGSDIIEIVPKEKYTDADLNYNNDNSRANKEQNDISSRPSIANEINIDGYDTIYIGYPIWWGTNPKIILTLLDNYNFDGKNILLFCTSGSSGIETSINDIKNYNSKINVLGGKRFNSSITEEEVKSWINTLK